MFELIGLGIAAGVAGVSGVMGHRFSRDYVRKKLRFTSIVEKPGLGLAAGAVATIAAAPVVAIAPFVGVGTALLFGAGVGTGVALGAKEARDG